MKRLAAQSRFWLNLLFISLVLAVSIIVYHKLFPPLSVSYIPEDLSSMKPKDIPAAFYHTELVAKPLQLPDTGALLGITFQDFNQQNLTALETAINHTFAIIGIYTAWGAKDNTFNQSFAASVHNLAAVPLISWEPWVPVSGYDRSESKVDEANYHLRFITSGTYDAYIRQFAQSVKIYGHPIIIRFAHEMNGNWYSWGSKFNTPGEYVAAWRHVHDIFTKTGVTNVTWLWSPNEIYTDPAVPDASDIAAFYPGDRYVDWVGFSSFNWAGLYKRNLWREPEEMYTETVQTLTTLHKPIVIAETASAASDSANMKAQWITELAGYIKHHPVIKAVIWFDAVDNGIDWRIESNEASETAFKQAFDSYFVGSLTE